MNPKAPLKRAKLTNTKRVRKVWPKSFALRWMGEHTWRWRIENGHGTCIGVGDTPRQAWEDAAEFVKAYGG